MSFNTAPVRPLGKLRDHDDQFGKLEQECKEAIQAGNLKVISVYGAVPQGATIGAVPTGGYPLEFLRDLLFLYRSIAGNQNFLKLVIESERDFFADTRDQWHNLAQHGVADCGTLETFVSGKPIQRITPLPLLEGNFRDPESQEPLTQIARSRIATAIKIAGFCQAKQLIPIYSGSAYPKAIHKVLANTKTVLDDFRDDPFWINRSRVLRIAHDEFLDEEQLDTLSISDVLRLRSSAWGKQSARREEFFVSVAKIAQDIESNDKFEDECRKLIGGYRKASEEVVRERGAFQFGIHCDLAALVLSGANTISNPQSPVSWLLTLFIGGVMACKAYDPQVRKYLDKEKELKRGAGFGLHQFYRHI